MIIRPPGPEEYEQIITCITEARGPNYYSKKFYDISYLQSGEHELFAAFDDNGVMTGFSGLSQAVFEKERTTLSLLNIRPAYTGCGIGTGLLSNSIELLKKRGARSVKGHVVTSHQYIQRVLEGLGLRPSGLLHGVRDGRNALPAVPDKYILAVYSHCFLPQDPVTLFVHSDAAGLAARVYSDLEIPVVIHTDGQNGSSNSIEYYYDSHDNVMFVQVTEFDDNLGEHLVQSNSSSVLHNDMKTLTEIVFLNLYNPSAINSYESLIKAGYKFCGFDPSGEFENAVFFKGSIHCVKPEMTDRLISLSDEIFKVGKYEQA